jgi:hypothetical protein
MIVSLGQLVQNDISVPASPGNLSLPVTTNGLSLVGIQFPATLTSTTVSFLVATSLAGIYQPLHNSSGLVTYTVAQGEYMAINPADFYGVQFFEIMMGSTEAAARTLQLLLKGI